MGRVGHWRRRRRRYSAARTCTWTTSRRPSLKTRNSARSRGSSSRISPARWACATTTTASRQTNHGIRGVHRERRHSEHRAIQHPSASNSASGTDPKFDLSYKIDKDVLLYATAAKGFRLGGVNQPIPVAVPGPGVNSVLAGNECALQAKVLLITSCSPNISPGPGFVLLQAPATFASDSVWNYEIGEKSAVLRPSADRQRLGLLRALDRPAARDQPGRIRHHRQRRRCAHQGPGGGAAGAAEPGVDPGVERWLHGRAHSLRTARSRDIRKGYNVPDIPKFTASATLRWKHPLTDDLSLIGSLEGNYVGTRTDAPYGETITLLNINTYLLHLPSYGFANLRLGVAGVGGPRWCT